jgi:adenylate cyclase
MIINDSPRIPVVSHHAHADHREDGDGAGVPLAEDPIPRLRHDLRNPVNQILGYGELLIEETDEGRRPGPSDGLQSILARGKQVLALIDDGLPARGQTKPEAAIDLPALRFRLLEPLARILADCDDLAREAPDPAQGEFRRDVARIRAAASRLVDLAGAMLAGPRPADGTPAP